MWQDLKHNETGLTTVLISVNFWFTAWCFHIPRVTLLKTTITKTAKIKFHSCGWRRGDRPPYLMDQMKGTWLLYSVTIERNSLPWGFLMSKMDLRNWWTCILKIGSLLEIEQQGKFFAGFSPLQKTSLCAQWNFSVYNCDFFFLKTFWLWSLFLCQG